MGRAKSKQSDEQTDSLQARLEDRERLVEELTSRLEMAAEQLDRLKRSGADRGGRIINGGGGLPAELVEQQQSLTEDLQNAVRNWEEMQPTVLLSRLEMQMGELRDLMVDGNGGTLAGGANIPPLAKGGPGGNTQSAVPATEPPPPSLEDTISLAPSDGESGMSIYEQFKAGLSGEATAEPRSPAEAPAAVVEENPTPPPQPVEPEIPEVDPPEAIDLESAEPDELRVAIDERDGYITYLLQRMRTREVALWPSGEWKDLEGVPEELSERLTQYEKQLEEMLRLAEVETSLERARLGREAAKLEQERQQIQSVISHLELQKESEDGDEDESAESNGKPSRLKRFLARWQGDD